MAVGLLCTISGEVGAFQITTSSTCSPLLLLSLPEALLASFLCFLDLLFFLSSEEPLPSLSLVFFFAAFSLQLPAAWVATKFSKNKLALLRKSCGIYSPHDSGNTTYGRASI